jgi:hypothetical protein
VYELHTKKNDFSSFFFSNKIQRMTEQSNSPWSINIILLRFLIENWQFHLSLFVSLNAYCLSTFFNNLNGYTCTLKWFTFNCVLIHTLVTWSFFPLYSSSICWWWWIYTMVWTCASNNIYIYMYTYILLIVLEGSDNDNWYET